jgi:hypothetical protein
LPPPFTHRCHAMCVVSVFDAEPRILNLSAVDLITGPADFALMITKTGRRHPLPNETL